MPTDTPQAREALLAFLTAHFSEPPEPAHLLVLADWLQEHDRHQSAALIRHVVGRPAGAAAADSADWSRQAAELALAVRRELGERTRLVGDDCFMLRRVPRRFRVGPGGIEGERPGGAGGWAPVPPEAWTEGLMEAALYVLLLRLATPPPG